MGIGVGIGMGAVTTLLVCVVVVIIIKIALNCSRTTGGKTTNKLKLIINLISIQKSTL